MVGLPDTAVRESRDRVRAAIRNSGFEFPQERITVNLAPADVRKAGAAFDLPIALGVLAASGVVTSRTARNALVIGELSLDGSMHPTRGVLPIAAGARRDGYRELLLPSANAAEASLVSGLDVLPVDTLREAVATLNGDLPRRAPPVARAAGVATGDDIPDLADVHGQAMGRRALELAAAGGHNLLLRRTARRGQDDARAPAGGIAAGADARRGAGGDDDPFGGGPAAAGRRTRDDAAVSRAASHGVGRRPRRRRIAAPAG